MGKADRHRGRSRKSSGDLGEEGGGGEFRAGMEVEVRSDEDGFRGAWYEATIARQLPQRGRFEIAYASLVEDHDPSLPLHEIVRRSNIRPRPPALQPASDAAPAGYVLHDLVEAFHNDGWWAGVISAVLGGPATGRYLISFPTSREQEVFDASQVRPQLNWTRGVWVPVDEQGAEDGKAMFAAGARVEVSRERDKYGAAWFSASVMKVLSKTTYLVGYEDLKAENDSESLIEIVDVQYVRPYRSNAVPEKDFVVNDAVEVLHHGGWALGKISQILDESRCIVMTIHDEEEIQLGYNELRRRQLWNGEEWVLDFQMMFQKIKKNEAKSAGRKRNSQVGKIYNLPISVSTSSDDGEVGCGSGSIKLSSKNKKAKAQHESSPVLEKTKKVKLLKYIKTPLLLEGPETPKENGSSIEQHHPGNPSMEQQHDVSNVNAVAKFANSDEGLRDIHGKGSGQQSKGAQATGAPISPENDEFVPLSEWRNGTVHGSTVKYTKRRAKLIIRAPGRLKKAANDDGLSQQSQESERREEHSSSGISEPNNSNETAQEVTGISCSRDKDDSSGCLDQDNSPQLCQQNDVLMLQGTASILDIMGNTTIKCLVTQSLPDDMFKTPTSGGILNSMRVYTEDQFIPLVMVTEKKCTESKQDMAPSETVIFEDKDALIDPSPRGPPSQAISLPFLKISSLWESIESMEVFQVMPQHPHFRPLEQYSMEFREGMAIGLMISFANLVATMRQLCIDSEATLNEKLRAIGPLEANGFDVHFLRSRLQELLKIQSHQKQYETRKASLESKILEKKDDNERLNYFITALDEAIVKLEQNLSSLHGKRDAMMTEKRSNDAEISKLEVDMHEAEESYNSTKESFDATLSAPW